MVAALPTFWQIVLIVALIVFTGELTSNLAAVVALLPILFEVARGLDVDPLLLCVPAVVAAKRARGLTLLALVDIAKPETSGRHFALVTRNVEAVPGHRIAIGERVPCAAVLSDRTTRNDSGVWQMVGPMPIAWGTRDQKIIADAVAQIPEVEWRVLKDKLKMVDQIDATDELGVAGRPGQPRHAVLELGELG